MDFRERQENPGPFSEVRFFLAVYEKGKALTERAETYRVLSIHYKENGTEILHAKLPGFLSHCSPSLGRGESLWEEGCMPSGWIRAFSSSSFSSNEPLVPVSRLGLEHKEQVALET